MPPRTARRARRSAPAPVVAALATLVGCAPTSAADVGERGSAPRGTLVVLAAASLTDVATDLADRLESDHPGLTVETAFGPSSTLAAQVVAGAPADVLLTASTSSMQVATRAVGGDPVVVARNRLQLAVPAGNPADVVSPADLADPGLTVALCAPEVPCGVATARVLTALGVEPAPDTLERDVRGVLTRLALDEADAGLVYRTDVLASSGKVEGIDLPEDAQVVVEHPALVLPTAPNPRAADAFVALLRSPEGRRTLADAGFELP